MFSCYHHSPKNPIIFQDKHEENHQPKLHGGLVIKHNANQRYATSAVTAFIFREIAETHGLPVQASYFLVVFKMGENEYKVQFKLYYSCNI